MEILTYVVGSIRGLGAVLRLPVVEARAHTRPWQRVHPASSLLSTIECTGTRTDPMRRPLRLWHFHFVGAGMQIVVLHRAHENQRPARLLRRRRACIAIAPVIFSRKYALCTQSAERRKFRVRICIILSELQISRPIRLCNTTYNHFAISGTAAIK